MEDKVLIFPVNSETFAVETYSNADSSLINTLEVDTNFSQSTDYIEYYVFDGNRNLIFPNNTQELLTYTVRDGHVILDPKQDLERLEFDEGDYFINYNFYRKHLNSDLDNKYYIEEISADRKEVRLNSTTISNDDIKSSTNEFISYRDSQSYFVDFYLNFGNGEVIISNNIKLDEANEEDNSVLIKLYDALPPEFSEKSECWVVEKVSSPQSYQVKFPIPIFDPTDFEFIAGPNLNLDIKNETGVSSISYSYETLINSNLTSSTAQIQSLLEEKGLKINIDYEDFNNFIKFSSAKTRLENFYYKAGLIENYTNQISTLDNNISSGTNTTVEFSESKATFENNINTIIKNFDSYEYFLYFNSGSDYSYPKSNSSPPYTLYSTGSSEVLDWIGNLSISASDYDDNNQDYLHWAIPEYLRDDPDNRQYDLFIDMIGQHFDNIWVYTKDVVNKFNGDNRLNYGISKDLVSDSIKEFGIKLYSNNFNTNDLYKAFLGITPSGSTFPYGNNMDYLPASSGYEYIDTKISASNDIVPLDDANKRLYKRIYHNIPYLLKTKGTIAGLKALITSYGIPDTILRVDEFGGKNKVNPQDWDFKQNVFNYSLNLGDNNYFSSSFNPNPNFSSDRPKSIQFRFKTNGVPSTHLSQSLFKIDDNTALVIEYTGSSYESGSYSGSIADPYKEYGTIKYIPNTEYPNTSASVYLPIFDGKWWSVMTTTDATSSLYVANKIDGSLGFAGSDSVSSNSNVIHYNNAAKIEFPSVDEFSLLGNTYTRFSGSIQEIRYYAPNISESSFQNYTLNPLSSKGNGLSTSDQLIFRADLGSLSTTSSRTSIHPKITGSWGITSSFVGNDSSYFILSNDFSDNKEDVYLNQVPQGIKNKVSDKISIFENIIPSGDTLSSERSIQQHSYLTQSSTPDADYLEVAFSPTNQINDDIIAELGNFNIGDYIGDPRQISSQNIKYPDLDTLRTGYFKKYIKSYNVKDFIRLIKFFDNSLFKMIKDFTPARTNLSSGVVVKQHLLERSSYSAPNVVHEDETYSGSIKSFARGYSTGSGDVINSNAESGSSIEVTSGGTVGLFERFNSLIFSPSGSDGNGPNNRFNITQSWADYFPSISGSVRYTRDDQREYYNGEFSQSSHVKMQRGLNIGEDDPCYPYTNWENVPDLEYRLEFLSGSDEFYRIEDYTPPPPVTGSLFERSLTGSVDDSDLPVFEGQRPEAGLSSCLVVNTESIYFDVQNITQIVSGTIAYNTQSLDQTFDGSDGSGNSLWWGIKESGSTLARNQRRVLINENGGIENMFLCRATTNAVKFTSSSISPSCYSWTVWNFDTTVSSNISYTSCSGVSYTEVIPPFQFKVLCLVSGSGVTVNSGNADPFQNSETPCVVGTSETLVEYAQIPTFPLSSLLEYTLSDTSGCWTYDGNVSRDLPTQTVVSQCGFVPPTTSSINLGYSSFSKANACDDYNPFATPQYYADNASIASLTELYSDTNGTFANSGWYSNGVVAFYWTGTSAQPYQSCTSGNGFEDIRDIDLNDNVNEDPYDEIP